MKAKFRVLDRASGYWTAYQEYPGAMSHPEYVEAKAWVRCLSCLVEYVAYEYDEAVRCRCGATAPIGTLRLVAGPAKPPKDFDHWGGREAPAGTHA